MKMKTEFEQYKSQLINIVESLGTKYGRHKVFGDFVEMAAISIFNSVRFDRESENKYLNIIRSYDKSEANNFPKLLAITTDALQSEMRDFLGECFHAINLNDKKHTGQVFTPKSVSDICAGTCLNKDEVLRKIKENGKITIYEPACGAGSMIISCLKLLKEWDINYQEYVQVVAQDIDSRCAYMTYIQLSLLGAQALVVIGNTITLENRMTLETPFSAIHNCLY